MGGNGTKGRTSKGRDFFRQKSYLIQNYNNFIELLCDFH